MSNNYILIVGALFLLAGCSGTEVIVGSEFDEKQEVFVPQEASEPEPFITRVTLSITDAGSFEEQQEDFFVDKEVEDILIQYRNHHAEQREAERLAEQEDQPPLETNAEKDEVPERPTLLLSETDLSASSLEEETETSTEAPSTEEESQPSESAEQEESSLKLNPLAESIIRKRSNSESPDSPEQKIAEEESQTNPKNKLSITDESLKNFQKIHGLDAHELDEEEQAYEEELNKKPVVEKKYKHTGDSVLGHILTSLMNNEEIRKGIGEALDMNERELESTFKQSVRGFEAHQEAQEIIEEHFPTPERRPILREVRDRKEFADASEEFLLYRSLALQGSPKAQIDLATMYYTGDGISQDHTKALYWLEKAADNDNPEAQYRLAIMYSDNESSNKQITKAVEWYKRAARQGHADAQYDLALIYYYGEGIVKDFEQAALWCFKAAEQGHREAQYSLAVMFERGEGIQQSMSEAFKWYQKSALQGYGRAQQKLIVLFHRGIPGVPKDKERSAFWHDQSVQFDDRCRSLTPRGC